MGFGMAKNRQHALLIITLWTFIIMSSIKMQHIYLKLNMKVDYKLIKKKHKTYKHISI